MERGYSCPQQSVAAPNALGAAADRNVRAPRVFQIAPFSYCHKSVFVCELWAKANNYGQLPVYRAAPGIRHVNQHVERAELAWRSGNDSVGESPVGLPRVKAWRRRGRAGAERPGVRWRAT